MTLNQELKEALTGLRLENAPTVERQEKSQFSTINSVWRVRTIAERLYGTDRISQDVFNACQKWAQTYVIAYDGPGAIQNAASTSTIRHDKISFIMDQALRADSIPAIKSAIGHGTNNLLVLTLYECYSAGYIADMLNLSGSKRSVEKAIDKECISAYERLNNVYLSLFRKKTLAD